MRTIPKVAMWAISVTAGLAILVIAASFALTPQFTRLAEKQMDRHLKGYTVSIEKVRPNIFNLSVAVNNIRVIQQAHPEPPVAEIPLIYMSLQWRELLSGQLVGDLLILYPKLHINLQQLRTHVEAKEKPKAKDWHDAVQSLYPFKINHFEVDHGDVVYIDKDPDRPLEIEKLDITSDNIRNIRSREKKYPSPFHVDCTVLGYGKATVDGDADFLREPHPGLRSVFEVSGVPVEKFRPVLERKNIQVVSGVLSASGEVEYAPGKQFVRLREVTVNGLKADYVHSAVTAAKEKERAEKIKEAAEEVTRKPEVLVRLDKLKIVDADLGMVNEAASPAYRVYLDKLDVTVTNLSNQFSQGIAEASLKGMFMGSGATRATATFRPEARGPDFDLNIAVEDTPLKSMNDLLRAYGKFDVVKGLFSFFMEVHVKGGRIDGYVKPFFKDMKVYDRRQDEEKRLFRKLYEMLVGGVSKLLESPREEVATKATIKGAAASPETSTWEVVVRLIQNAFFRMILPGFEREAGHEAALEKKRFQEIVAQNSGTPPPGSVTVAGWFPLRLSFFNPL